MTRRKVRIGSDDFFFFNFDQTDNVCTNHVHKECTMEGGCLWSQSVSYTVPLESESGRYWLEYNTDRGMRRVHFVVGCVEKRAQRKDSLLMIVDFITNGAMYSIYGGRSYYNGILPLRTAPYEELPYSLHLPVAFSNNPYGPDYTVNTSSNLIPREDHPFTGNQWPPHMARVTQAVCYIPMDAIEPRHLDGFERAAISGKQEYIVTQSMDHLHELVD